MFDVLVTSMLVLLIPFLVCFVTLAVVKPAFVRMIDNDGNSSVLYGRILIFSILASLLAAFIVKMYTDDKREKRDVTVSFYCSGRPHSSF